VAIEEHKPECKDLMMPGLGTCCPSCGHRQAHTHVGWQKLAFGEVKKIRGKNIKTLVGKILITQVNCEKCGHNSIIIRYTDDANVKDLCDFLDNWK